ncbi:purine-nucleoside phosphorylase [Bdellovibrionota bacterium FG-2]
MKSNEVESIALLKKKYAAFGISAPSLHIVLGSGLGVAFETTDAPKEWNLRGEIGFGELPGLKAATVPGHSGIFKYYEHRETKKTVTFQLGRLHGYEGLPARQVIQTVLCAKLAGTERFVLTNAAGSLSTKFPVGSVMLLKDHVNMTGHNPLVGPNPAIPGGQVLGPRFPDMSEVYEEAMRNRLGACFKKNGLVVNEGTYLGLLGPSFETPAEVALFARWGLDAVGMSTVWEAIILRHMGAKIAGLSLISNLGCGLGGSKNLNHEEVLEEGKKAAVGIVQTFFEFSKQEFTTSDR